MTDFLPHVYGQEKVKKEWKRLLEERRLPHTMILYGDEGLGKTTAADGEVGKALGGDSSLAAGVFRQGAGRDLCGSSGLVSSSDGDGAQDRAVPSVFGRDGNIR